MSLFWDPFHFWNFQSLERYNRRWKRGKNKSWKSETGTKENTQGIVSLKLILIATEGYFFSSYHPFVHETLEIFDSLITRVVFFCLLLCLPIAQLALSKRPVMLPSSMYVYQKSLMENRCETLLSPQKDNLYSYILTYIRKLFLKAVSTEPDVWSQAGGNEYISLSSQTREDGRGGIKALHVKQDVTSTQPAKHPTPQGLAKDRAEPREYLIWLLSVSSILGPICCPNVSSIWEKTLNLDGTLEPI